MSDIIHLLPDSVANQIAAGEVIQRPASVIKELVENAVDAGAKNVNVAVVDAGRTSIQVVDDGSGMSDTDARLAFERHSTSKIQRADDLFALHTMGFRGEALASIVAVAQVELRTRLRGTDIGTRLTLSASRVTAQEPVACPAGSNFIVSNLFFNVPARRKFLKSNATELANILAAYERVILVYPEIGFTLRSNGADLINVRAGSLRQRIIDVFGKRIDQDLLPVDVETALCSIKGFVGKPEAARKKGAHQYFFVNGRYMRHAYFHKAVAAAYERLVPVGMQVPYFVYFNVDPHDIDVNIHPTKTEIKFENEQAIWQILAATVKDAIGRFCEIPSIDFDTEGQPDIPAFDPSRHTDAPKPTVNPSYNPFNQTHQKTAGLDDGVRKKSNTGNWEALYQGMRREEPSSAGPDLFSSSDVDKIADDRSPAHYQYKGKYIMTAVKSGLMIIDQHRADVRIRYERLMGMMSAQGMDSQRVLFPEVVQFSPSQQALLPKIMPYLEKMGFALSDLGQGSYSVNGVPAGKAGIDYVELLGMLVADAVEDDASAADATTKSLSLSMARHTAVTYGEVLTNAEMENIVNELFRCSNVNYTPDGKAILCILPQRDIEQLLG